MSAEYSIQVDPSRDLIRIRMSGFFTLADVDGFLAARAKAHAELTCRRNAHLTINDLREMKIQSQEIVDAFRAMLAAPEYRSRRLAFIVSSTLARSQLGRALANRHARCFEDSDAAEAWLLGAGEESQAA
ncbi:hypothetical protein IAG41_12785 [Sphingomonas sp. JC676]|uniref:STAS/SEC14 domain-containing protein n=1 Tax=Sphingomonas sp. JC676 TaxID=2768065 RepID=UPI00165774BA|nr:STAS/SEC14 domain-containing protein [Sphingomonas sp. JC676]MBC9033267.1 hypothetical protein [Sphingomonas sp. JC676]